MAQNNTKNFNNIFQHDYVMVSESIVCFETSGHCWAVGHREPESAVWHCQSSTKTAILGGELGALDPKPFSKPKNCRSNTTNCNFRPGFEFSNPNMPDDIPTNKSKKCTAFSPVFNRYKWNVPHSTWVRSLPHPPGARFYAPQPRATPMMSPSWGQSLQFKVRAPPDQNKRAKRRPNPKHDATWISQ